MKQGTLRIASAKSLGKEADVRITQGAKLELDFNGGLVVAKLTIDGKIQPPGTYSGTYSVANFPASFTGKGAIVGR